MIRILIVDDSNVVTMLLKAIFEEQPDMEVVGIAHNGRDAVDMVAHLKPDLVTMDIQMPVMDGLHATREIMSKHPAPIIVVSSAVAGKETQISFQAIEEGALSIIEKPPGISHPNFDSIRRELIDTARTMAGMKLVRRTHKSSATPLPEVPSFTVDGANKASVVHDCELIALGCSTGGPQALHTVLSRLPVNFPLPVVVVQHISQGFISGMVDWLQINTRLKLKVVTDGEELQAGTVYFAPDDEHLLVRRGKDRLIACLENSAPVNRFRPSATPLLESVAHICPRTALGILLTGMGNDGAQGLLAMRKAGCHTIVQDEKSCVVFGMPKAALELEAVDEVITLDTMAAYLVSAVTQPA